jgi:Predicted metal binding domain
MHPELSRKLFDEQVAKITGNADLLVDRGWLVLFAVYPELTIAVRHRRTNRVRVFRFLFEDWNDQPPRLSFVDGETLETLPGTMWPKSPTSYWHATGWQPAGSPTPTAEPFMCMAGIREYHTHTSHVTDSWENYKNQSDFDLGGIVSKVTEVFQKSDV